MSLDDREEEVNPGLRTLNLLSTPSTLALLVLGLGCTRSPLDSDLEKPEVGAIENEQREEAGMGASGEGEERGAPPPSPDADERLD